MTTDTQRLTARWRALGRSLGVASTTWEDLLGQLFGRYAEAHRAYHTLRHIEEVLVALDRLRAAGEPDADPQVTELAAWFHDAVYDPRADDNEACSAELAAASLGAAGLAARSVERVRQLILTTEQHVAGEVDAALLVDADLTVLGGGRLDYQAYALAIRREYVFLDDERYRQGRVAVLRGLLERPVLYHTDTMRAEREDQARGNMQVELDALTAQPEVAVDEALRRVGG